MKKIIFILGLLLLVTVNIVFCFDWRSLHEKATVNDLKDLDSVKLDPLEKTYIQALINLSLHNDVKARDFFEDILERDSKNIAALWGTAEVLRREHKLEESEKILNKIIKIDKGFAPAYISLSYIQYINLNFEDSVRLAAYVIKQGKDKVGTDNYVRAILMFAGAKGMIAHFGGPLSKAINGIKVFPNLKRAEKILPDAPAVLFGLGSFYLLAPSIIGGDLEKAEEYLRKAIEKDPLFVDPYVRLAQVYRLNNKEEEFSRVLNKALEIDPKSELALDIKSGECNFICFK